MTKLNKSTENSELTILEQIKLTPILESVVIKDIPDSVYFSDKYSNYVSNSKLGLINPKQGGSPEAYFKGFPKNSTNDSFILGSALHELVLQPDDFILCDKVDRPTAKLGYVADDCWLMSDKSGKMVDDEVVRRAAVKFDYYKGDLDKIKKFIPEIAKYIKQRASYEASGNKQITPIYLASKVRDKLELMLNSIKTNASIQHLLNPIDCFGDKLSSENEQTILMDMLVEFPDGEKLILKLKSKLDNFYYDIDANTITINDVKTSSKYCKYFREAFYEYHYYREFGMYSFMLYHACKALFGMNNPEIKGNCLVVETTTNDHNSCVYQVSKNDIAKGIKEFAFLLKRVAYYTRYGIEN